jgi:hypothetical protein
MVSGVVPELFVDTPVAWLVVLTTLAVCCGLIWFVRELANPRREVGPGTRSERWAA